MSVPADAIPVLSQPTTVPLSEPIARGTTMLPTYVSFSDGLVRANAEVRTATGPLPPAPRRSMDFKGDNGPGKKRLSRSPTGTGCTWASGDDDDER